MDIQIFAVKNLIGLDSFRLTPTPQYSLTKDYIPKEDIAIYPLRIFKAIPHNSDGAVAPSEISSNKPNFRRQ